MIQARTDSARLPAKALLPVCGIPLALLAAMRAANTGHEVILATSTRAVDDDLAHLADARGLSVIRGDADDVRSRFLDATNDLSEVDIVVRLTADNPLPDGHLVTALVEEFLKRKPLIASLGAPDRTLPYGLSAEAMTVGDLRCSASWRVDALSKEHVTTALWDRQRTYVSSISHPLGDLAHLRCTVDTFDDYERIRRVFASDDDPIGIPWQDLVARLAVLGDAPWALAPGPGFSLGTVQLGIPYGSVTIVEPPPRDEAKKMVRRAIDHGAHLDTARAYGHSEQIIGDILQERGPHCAPVVTKLDPLSTLGSDVAPKLAVALAEASVFRSLAMLGKAASPSLLLHRAEHRLAWDGAVWRALQTLRNDGWVSRLGVSVACPDEMVDALQDPDVAVVQCSRNILDHRWNTARVKEALLARPDVEIEVRSAFLQGVLLAQEPGWPQVAGVNPREIIATLDVLVASLGRANRADLCIAWLRAEREISSRVDRIVVGAQNLKQLEKNLEYWSKPPLTRDEVFVCGQALPHVPPDLLDPAKWPRR